MLSSYEIPNAHGSSTTRDESIFQGAQSIYASLIHNSKRPDSQTGFTLIEVMIAVAIVGILSAIAVPAYNDHVTRGKIPDATSNLSAKRVQLEQFFQDNRTYVGTNACASDTTTSQFFDFSCSTQTGTTYVLQAVGKDSMTGFTFSIDEGNTRTTDAVPTGWTIPSPNNCWVTKKGGSC